MTYREALRIELLIDELKDAHQQMMGARGEAWTAAQAAIELAGHLQRTDPGPLADALADAARLYADAARYAELVCFAASGSKPS